MSLLPDTKFPTLLVEEVPSAPKVLHVKLNRADKLNAYNADMWRDILQLFTWIGSESTCRCVILSAEGRIFTAGLDLGTLGILAPQSTDDVARSGLKVLDVGSLWQNAFTAIEQCRVPVIACVHSTCIGAGVEMISACDIRLCSEDAKFALKEAEVGIACDVGGAQRFPKIVGNDSLVRELVYTSRFMPAAEAEKLGFVSRVLKTKEEMIASAVGLARQIAGQSPVAIVGAKRFLNFSRDHTVQDSLNYAITWNMAMMQGSDMAKIFTAKMEKKPAEFPDLFSSKL